MAELKVKVTALAGKLIVEPIEPEKGEPEWVPVGGSKIGSVLMDCSKRLGISDEALAIMRTLEVGRDAIGDLDWWACDDETWAFGWFGCLYRIIDPEFAVTARDFSVDKAVVAKAFVPIPNEPPARAVTVATDTNEDCWDVPMFVASKG